MSATCGCMYVSQGFCVKDNSYSTIELEIFVNNLLN